MSSDSLGTARLGRMMMSRRRSIGSLGWRFSSYRPLVSCSWSLICV
jgi:hypothetical protein